MSMDPEHSATLTSLSVRSTDLYHRREERNLLPGCFLTSGACFTLILLDLVRQLQFGSPLSLPRSDPDGCAPIWKEGDLHRSSSADWRGPCSCGLYVAALYESPPRESNGCLLFSVILHEPRGEPSNVPGSPLIGVGWCLGHSHKTNSYYSLNSKLNQNLALMLLIIKHLTVILKYFNNPFCIFILAFLWIYI